MQHPDRVELQELKARYSRLLDTKQWEDWREIFAKDAKLPTAHDMVADRESFVQGVIGMVGSLKTLHHFYMPELELVGPGQARGVWAYRYELIWGGSAAPSGLSRVSDQYGFASSGYYEEDYRRQEGRWRVYALRARPIVSWALVTGQGSVVIDN